MKIRIGFALLCSAAVLAAPPVLAQQAPVDDYDVASQDLGTAITQVALKSGRQIVVSDDLVRGRRAPALRGRYSPEAALDALLAGSGLRAVMVGNTLVVQRSDTPGQDDESTVILVTGSRIRGHGPVGSPVITIDRKAIDQAGFATTQQIIQSLPQNFSGGANENTSGLLTAAGNGNSGRGSGLNLRGLGQNSTLLLINGDRPPLGGVGGTFADISVIPASIIERIEVVPDGASAIYGSDAVAGVVNVITRLNFSGAESSFRFGTADGDSQEYQASQLLGTRWSSGSIMVAYEYYKRDSLAAADRDFATEDLRAFGGPDRRGNYGNPGTIVAGGVNYAIPTGQNGVGLSPSRLTPGVINRVDRWYGTDLLPEQKRHSVFAAFSQDILPGLRFYARGLATWRDFDLAIQASGDTRRTVPVTNPFYVDPIGTRQPVGVMYSFVRDLGPERTGGRVKAYGGTAGLEAQLGSWRIDGHGTWGRQVEQYGLFNRINTARLALALADTNPATAYNLFGDGPSTNPSTIESIRGYTLREYGGWSWSAALRADGPLFTLPAGIVRLAAGGEFRKDSYKDIRTLTYTSTLTPVPLAITPFPGPRTVKSAYAELLLPIFGEGHRIPGFYKLDISAAIRAERYSDFGDTQNPRLSLAWETVPGLTFRGTFGRSFRAPTFPEKRQDPGSMAYYAWSAADPTSPTGSSNMLVIAGNDPNLRPERATTWTAGVDLRPQFLPGFEAGLTWFKVNYTDRIATPRPNLGNFLINRDVYGAILTPNPSRARIAEFYASPFFLDLLGIPQTATFVAIADARLQNLSLVKQSGIDLNFSYAFDLAGGRASLGGSGTYIFYIRQSLTKTAPSINVVNTIGNPVDLRARGHISWARGGFTATVFGNHVAGYTNRTVSPFEPVSSWTTFDLNLSYSFTNPSGPFAGMRIALTGNNIFDRRPPYVNYTAGTYTAGYDAENASPIGRFVAVQVTKKW